MITELPSRAAAALIARRLWSRALLALAVALPAVHLTSARAQDTDAAVTSFTIDVASATLTHAAALVTFDRSVNGLTPADFAVNGRGNATATNLVVSGSGTQWRLDFDYTGTNGSLQIGLRSTGAIRNVSDLANFRGRGVAATQIEGVNNAPPTDITPPTVTSFVAAPPSGSIIRFTITFSEPVSGFSTDDLWIPRESSVTLGAPTPQGGSSPAATWEFSMTFNGGPTTVPITILGGVTPNIRDAAGNWFRGGSAGGVVTSTANFATAPEINVKGPRQTTEPLSGIDIASGDNTPSGIEGTDFGNVAVAGGMAGNTFLIQNTGTATLTLPSITVFGPNASDFIIVPGPATSIAAGGTLQFGINFDPSAAGLRTATLRIENNDPNENPYTFSLQGTGTIPSPEINVQGNGVNIVSGDTTPSTSDWTDFGSLEVGREDARVFTIQNLGTADLTVGNVTVSGSSAFTVAAPAPVGINASGSGTFRIRFMPTAVGPATATVSIPNNDADENPYTFVVRATATASTTAPATRPIAFLKPGPGTYVPGVAIGFAVRFNGEVSFTGTPRIPIQVGTVTRYATARGMGMSDTIGFIYTVAAGERDGDGITMADAIELNGGTITGSDGRPANLSLNQPELSAPGTFDLSTVWVANFTPPSGVPNVRAATVSAVVTGGYTFLHMPHVAGTPTSFSAQGLPPELAINASTGLIGQRASFTSGLPLTVPVTLTANNEFGAGNGQVTLVLQPNTRDRLPDVMDVASVGTPANGTYRSGDTLTFTIKHHGTDTRPTIVIGTARLPITIGTRTRYAVYDPEASLRTLVFRYSVAPDDVDEDGISLASAIDLDGVLLGDPPFLWKGWGIPVDTSGIRIAGAATPTPAPVVSNATVAGQVGTAIAPVQVAATNNPTSFSAPGLATYGLQINASGLITGTPTTAASGIAISVTASNAGGASAPATLTLNLSAAPPTTTPPTTTPPVIVTPPIITTPPTTTTRIAQTITFNSPVSGIMVGQPVALGATSSAGLPITYSVISGNATLSGSVLTPQSSALLIVRASSAGNDVYAAASTDVNFGQPRKAAQSISLAALGDTTTAGRPIALAATTSAGLPISYSVSGPARIEGTTLVLNGAAGNVTIRGTAAGNDAYEGAELTRTFSVRAIGQQVYLGKAGSDTVAIVISPDNTRGTFLTRFAASGEAIVATFRLNANGSFSGNGTSSLPSSNASAGSPATAALVARTVNGTVVDGVASGTIPELGTSFTANVLAPTGATASLAGLYTATLPGSALGEAYVIVDPTGKAYAVAMTPFGVTSGTGTVSSTGEFNLAIDGGSIAGTVNADGTLRGTLTNRVTTAALRGLSETTERTDRLVNLSSRLRTSGDSARAMIAGFVVTGTEPKPMLIRAIGPGLGSFGVSGALSNPRLQVYDSAGALVAENEDWGGNADVAAAASAAGAFALDRSSRDAALLLTLPPGPYTAQVATNGGEGVALVEVYDAAAPGSNTRQLINISTRGFVDTGEGNLIAGFVVTGNAPKRVLIRGIGPGLAPFGVRDAVANPTLTLYATGNTTPIARNDDWTAAQSIEPAQVAATPAEIAAASATAGAFALGSSSRDAAIVITLLPGAYTAVVGDATGGSGAGLVEVYELSNR